MEDSFFGFDTSVPLDDDGGGQIAEPSEEEYDALNDETFGSAINGDWEEVHENLVRLTGDVEGDGDALDSGALGMVGGGYSALSGMKCNRSQRLADSDLELNLSGMKLDDVDLNYGDNESISGILDDTVKMDPSVWSLDVKDRPIGGSVNSGAIGNQLSSNPEDFLRKHFPTPFQHHHQQQNQDQNSQQHNMKQQQQQSSQNLSFGLPQFPPQIPLSQSQQRQPKICTLEDIERNMIMQQSISKQLQVHQQEQHQNEADMIAKQQKILHDILRHSSETPTPLQQPQQQQHIQHPSLQHQQQQQHQQMLSQQYSFLLAQKGPQGPRGFVNPNHQSPPRPSNNFTNNLAQHPLGNLIQQQQHQQEPTSIHNQVQVGPAGNRLPPGFYFQQPQLPPHPLLNHHGGLPNNFPNQRPLPNAHLPVALNNFAMHPNFNAMRAAVRGIHPAAILAQQQQQSVQNRIPGHPPNPMMLLNQNPNSSNSSFNMFNMRLVQEIQQNHPLLQNAARQSQQHQPHNVIGQNHNNINNNHNQRSNAGPNAGSSGNGVSGNQKQSHNRRDGVLANGNLPHDEFDEYANLMSTREKHWLIGIQLSQLNTDTPYIDDYYYTVYKERKVVLSGNLRHSQAHKDNQLNHPLTQPKGHAQLILVQLGNKNGQRNGQHRERRNSENHNQSQELKLPTYVFTPLKFENSLGKLQYGSVTAPRKIIDADIMGNETSDSTGKDSSVQSGSMNASGGTQANVGVGSKSETPALVQTSNTAGDTTAVNSQRKSRYILLHIETLYRILLKLDDLNNPNVIATILMKKKKESERIAALEQLENANKTPEERATDSSNNPSMKSKFNYEIETKDALIEKLVAGLQHDKVVAMMNVRKGKVLIRRIMPNIENHDVRWNVWIGVFSSLQNVLKKDRDDAEGVLYSLYPEFNKQIKSANFEIIVKISSAITLNDKKSNGVFCSKFGISSLVCLILQAENIYVAEYDVTLSESNKNSWRQFLDQVASSLNRTIQNQTICAAIESDSIQPIMNHFARFKDLKLDSLLALITEAKQQIN
ncbi:protein associated with topo II related - 1 [Cochliomyia hominivorax]